MFNSYDYNDNVAYCEYVFNKNEELDLGLNGRHEIQYVANKYIDRLIEVRGFADEEVYENDKILKEVAEKAKRKLNNIKNRNNSRMSAERREKIEEKVESKKEDLRKTNSKIEKEILGHIHSYSDSYDDMNLDEFIDEDYSQIIK